MVFFMCLAYRFYRRVKGSIFLKNWHFLIQEKFNKLIYNINKCRCTNIDYVTSHVWDHKCTGPTNAWLVRCLSWKIQAFRDLAETIDTVAVPTIVAKTANNASIPIAGGWIMRLMTSAYKICNRCHFEFLSLSLSLRILFLSILRNRQKRTNGQKSLQKSWRSKMDFM